MGIGLNEACSGDMLNELPTIEKELIQWRCNVTLEISDTICQKHYSKFIKCYALHQRKCCDPFRSHRKTVTSKIFVIKTKESLEGENYMVRIRK